MNVKQRYRRAQRRRQQQRTASKTRRIHLFESLEVRAAPGSMLVMAPVPIGAMNADPASNEVLPALERHKSRSLRASAPELDVTGNSLLPFGDTTLGTSQFTVMRDHSPTSITQVPARDLSSDEDPFAETAATDAEHLPPRRSGARGTSSPAPSSSASSSSPSFGGLADSTMRTVPRRPVVSPPSSPSAAGGGSGPTSSATAEPEGESVAAAASGSSQQDASQAASPEVPQVTQNPANRLDVNADGVVSPLDALHIINGLNRQAASGAGSATATAAGQSDSPVFPDVNGDGHTTPLDALFVINYLNLGVQESSEPRTEVMPLGFVNGLEEWHVEEFGGQAPDQGTVRVGSAILTEGNSFLVTLERSLTIPDGADQLSFTYSDLAFDSSDRGLIKDAFEVALVDADGRSLVHTFEPQRDAFFNVSEGLPAVVGSEVALVGQTVVLDLHNVQPDSEATLIFRLVNNDHDQGTWVRITSVELSVASADRSPEVTVVLENDTAPDSRGGMAYRNDLITNDPTLVGTALDDVGIDHIEVNIDDGAFIDVTSTLTDDQFQHNPGQLSVGGHRATVRVTDTAGQQSLATLDFQVNAPPVADAGGVRAAVEGATVLFDGSGSSDTEDSPFLYQWTMPGDVIVEGRSAAWTFEQDGVYAVTLNLTDTAGSVVSDTVQVVVDNQPPEVESLSDRTLGQQEPMSLLAFFSDPGRTDVHTGEVDWGDGSTTALNVSEQGGMGTGFAAHAYQQVGTFQVTVRLGDELQTATESLRVEVESEPAALQPVTGKDDGAWGYRQRGIWQIQQGGWNGDYRTRSARYRERVRIVGYRCAAGRLRGDGHMAAGRWQCDRRPVYSLRWQNPAWHRDP